MADYQEIRDKMKEENCKRKEEERRNKPKLGLTEEQILTTICDYKRILDRVKDFMAIWFGLLHTILIMICTILRPVLFQFVSYQKMNLSTKTGMQRNENRWNKLEKRNVWLRKNVKSEPN